MWRHLIIPILVVVVVCVAGCSPRAPKPLPLGYTRVSCPAVFNGLPQRLECGTMVVEETRGAHNGRHVMFPVVIAHAKLNNKKPDPVIFLHGGPGGGVIDNLPDLLRSGRFAPTDDRDWIYFDQRGTGDAMPSLDCGVAPLSDTGVTNDAGVAQLQACGQKLAAQGVDLSQYNSAVIVKDIRDLRASLHIKTYNLYAISYGTRVAMAVMQHDPADLRAAALDSVWPPEASATGPLPGLVSREVRQILRLCAVDAECARRYPAEESRLDHLMRAWLTAPVHSGGKTYTADGLAAYLLDAVYDSEGARRLPSSIDAILNGHYDGLDAFMVAQSDYFEGQFFTTMCKEEFPFERPEAIDGGGGKDPIAAAVARDSRRFFPVCKGFPVGPADPVENQPLTSAIPTLLLTADIDAGCPEELSTQAVKTLSQGVHINFRNRTHGVTRQSACARAMLNQFIATADPHVDAGCLKTDQPKFQFLYPP